MNYFNIGQNKSDDTSDMREQDLEEELKTIKQANAKLKSQVTELSKINQTWMIKYEQSETDFKKNINFYKEQMEKLQQQVTDYKSEAAHYQSELGGIKNLQDENSIVKLRHEIEDLKDALETLTTTKKRDVNKKGVKNLLDKYQLKYKSHEKFPNNLISAVMQRHIIELILEYLKKHFEESVAFEEELETTSHAVKNERQVDKMLIKSMQTISENIETFGKIHPIRNEFVNITMFKIQQQIYNLLSSRKFDIENSQLFKSICELVVSEMEKVFSFNSGERTKFMKKAIETIHKCITTLYFNVKLQYPYLEIVWLTKGHPVNNIEMDDDNINDIDDTDNAIVEICKFPLIKEIDTQNVVFTARVKTMLRNNSNPFSIGSYGIL
ncbi:6416_t:CDS:1 [Ambispora gerdemannii]|uniref:6416_t:CDS:1 n=1 Tax=Ambispora gerdemannii TaxID=144530 RepID=A0A9N9B7P5_9GLOM|nr:6416_t:CDS:1 [Ambispora gerdemannii]